MKGKSVAPLTGAWIETKLSTHVTSVYHVAPLTGAWIETPTLLHKRAFMTSHPSRVRGLKPVLRGSIALQRLSHPSRVRGLKHLIGYLVKGNILSHPSRVRGLKHPWSQC